MGYTLKIGEAKINWGYGEEYQETYCSVNCDSVELPEAPAFGEPTDHTSERWPSYTSWHNFCRDLGIYELMFNKKPNDDVRQQREHADRENCLIQDHPGAMPITQFQVDEVRAALDAYKKKHPDHIAKYPPILEEYKDQYKKGDIFIREEHQDKNPIYDGILCRAEWLLFWMQWAVDNCEQPVFVNS